MLTALDDWWRYEVPLALKLAFWLAVLTFNILLLIRIYRRVDAKKNAGGFEVKASHDQSIP